MEGEQTPLTCNPPFIEHPPDGQASIDGVRKDLSTFYLRERARFSLTGRQKLHTEWLAT